MVEDTDTATVESQTSRNLVLVDAQHLIVLGVVNNELAGCEGFLVLASHNKNLLFAYLDCSRMRENG